MEETRTDESEIDLLLCEIPKATSGNPHSDESARRMVYLNESLSSARLNSYRENSIGKLQNNGRLNKYEQLPSNWVQSDELNLPDDQSLTSAFAGMSFNEGVAVPAVSAAGIHQPLVSKPMQCYASSLHGMIHNNNLKKQNSDVDSRMMYVSSYRTSNNVPCDFYDYGFDVTKHGHESTNFSRFSPQEPRRGLQVANYQPMENFPTAVPLDHSVTGFPYLSNLPVSGMQFPIMTDQQPQFYLDPLSSLPYHRQQQYHRFLRLQQQYNMQENGNIPNRYCGRNPRQTHYEVAFPHQCEPLKPSDPFWENFLSRTSNHLNHSFSPIGFNATKAWDKTSAPERILARSHGLRFGSVGGNDLLSQLGQNGRPLQNGHLSHNLSNHDCCNLNNMLLCPDTDYKSCLNAKLLPQKYTSLDEASGRIYLMAKDQHGCRFLQRKFSEKKKHEVDMIFEEIVDHVVELMTDPFGNYLVQKLLEVCDEDQRLQTLHCMTCQPGELVRISCDMHGTRAVQKVIETLQTPEQFSMVVSALKFDTLTLMKDTNGNHVAQRCLQYLSHEYSEFLFEAALLNCVDLASDRHGCCVLQKCLAYSNGDRRRHLICEIVANALVLSQDPYGNYVVQYIYELGLQWAKLHLLDLLEGSFGDLSMQKHSSNVVEKSLKFCDEEGRTRIIQELIDNPKLDQIMQDPYGNYVVQVAIELAKGSLHAKLVDAIKPHVAALRTSPYGKKVLSNLNFKK
ncbi:pumilio homolog 12 [Humulus lupulus]|uniref:pumilio homolog 12 n=1 Tax=Humulus lupulus TaxID=3486 RepID=UPI002B4025CE|nr:pumilio homolog 12 [Humulus lupulus]XP_062076407.1 pumilio homolog 12 [Humulus lupulus]XP_062076408.1 pumilio homolog 12 [Humulus lupulus]